MQRWAHGGSAPGAAPAVASSRRNARSDVEKVAKRRSRSAAAAIVFSEYSIGSWYLCSRKRKRTASGRYCASTCDAAKAGCATRAGGGQGRKGTSRMVTKFLSDLDIFRPSIWRWPECRK